MGKVSEIKRHNRWAKNTQGILRIVLEMERPKNVYAVHGHALEGGYWRKGGYWAEGGKGRKTGATVIG